MPARLAGRCPPNPSGLIRTHLGATRKEAAMTVWVGMVVPVCGLGVDLTAFMPSGWDLSGTTYGCSPLVLAYV